MSSDISSIATSSAPLPSRPSTPPHFDVIIRTEYVQSETTGKRKRHKTQYTCKHCSSYMSNHRVNTINHVISRHPFPGGSQASQSTATTQRDISTMLTSISSHSALRNSFNQQAYREALVGLLTRRRMPFSAVEWSEMRDLALACNPAIEDLLITSRRTAVRFIAANHQLYREQIKASLSTAISPIHISSDLWTSPSRSSLLAICVQWVDHEYRLQKALLGLRECRYNHSGEQQAILLLQTLETYDIQSRIGWHTGDNATSNNTCLEVLESPVTY